MNHGAGLGVQVAEPKTMSGLLSEPVFGSGWHLRSLLCSAAVLMLFSAMGLGFKGE